MIKKQLAIFFIFLANTILLAHAVVPHHHHETQVCIQNSCCTDNEKPDQQNTLAHSHEHNGQSGFDLCILKQLVLLPSNNEQGCKCGHHFDGLSPHDGFQAEILIPGPAYLVPTETAKPEGFWVNISWSFLAGSSTGLRAPPTV
jgi:hypothetical protein